MKTYVQKGDTLDVVAPSGGVTSGVGFFLGALFLIAASNADEGEVVAASRTGVFDHAAATGGGQSGAVGDPVYFDSNAKALTITASGNKLVGVLGAAKATGDTTARVVLVPRISEAAANVAALTENGGAIGGTNDGNLPNISSVSASYVQAEVTAIRDAVREIAAKVNAVIAS